MQVWTTLLDVDFTVEPTQSLAADGDYTIAGYTFTKTYSSQEANPAVLTNGVGVVIEPTSDTDNWNTRQNFPRLAVSLPASISKFGHSTRLRAWLRMTGNYGAQYDQTILQIENTGEGHHLAWERAYISGAIRRHPQVTFSNASEDVAAGLADGGYDVFVIDCNGVGLGRLQYIMYSGTWSSGWPAASSLVPTYWWANDQYAPQYYVALGDPSGWAVALGAARGWAGTAGFKGTLQALKVEYVRT